VYDRVSGTVFPRKVYDRVSGTVFPRKVYDRVSGTVFPRAELAFVAACQAEEPLQFVAVVFIEYAQVDLAVYDAGRRQAAIP